MKDQKPTPVTGGKFTPARELTKLQWAWLFTFAAETMRGRIQELIRKENELRDQQRALGRLLDPRGKLEERLQSNARFSAQYMDILVVAEQLATIFDNAHIEEDAAATADSILTGLM